MLCMFVFRCVCLCVSRSVYVYMCRSNNTFPIKWALLRIFPTSYHCTPRAPPSPETSHLTTTPSLLCNPLWWISIMTTAASLRHIATVSTHLCSLWAQPCVEVARLFWPLMYCHHLVTMTSSLTKVQGENPVRMGLSWKRKLKIMQEGYNNRTVHAKCYNQTILWHLLQLIHFWCSIHIQWCVFESFSVCCAIECVFICSFVKLQITS